jgi:hypothetical protein
MLVASALSPGSGPALVSGAALAAASGARLHVFHCVEEPAGPFWEGRLDQSRWSPLSTRFVARGYCIGVLRFDMRPCPGVASAAMGIPSAGWQRCGRALFVGSALFATLIATGVPLLHALAHEHAREHAHAHRYDHADPHHHTPSGSGEEHDEIHPGSLHDEGLIVPRPGLDLAVASFPESSLGTTALVVAEVPSPGSSSLHSRAPPHASPARAPPLV